MTPSPIFRRVVLWRWNDRATPELRLRAKEGLAYISFASRVDAVDFGEDIGFSGQTNYGLALLREGQGALGRVGREKHRAGDRALPVKRLGLRPVVLATALRRLRQRFRELTDADLADTVASAEELVAEQATLLTALRSG